MSRSIASRRRPATHARLAVEVLDDRTAPAFLAPVDYPAGANLQAVAAADFNNDAVPDLAVADSGGIVRVLLGHGDGTFQPAITSPTGSSPVALAAGDFNGDGNLDLVTA